MGPQSSTCAKVVSGLVALRLHSLTPGCCSAPGPALLCLTAWYRMFLFSSQPSLRLMEQLSERSFQDRRRTRLLPR